MKKFLKNNYKVIIGIIIGGIISGGVVYASTIASSEVLYTKNNQSTVEGALDELYSRLETPYKYWTDNYSSTQYVSASAPTTLYNSYAEIVGSASQKVFIRTTYASGSPVEHYACLYISGRVFCLTKGYWSFHGSNSTTAKIGLQIEMASALGISTSSLSCTSDSSRAYCSVGSARCYAYSGGSVNCDDNSDGSNCNVYFSGSADCS